jgi:hypothetical protein
LPEPLAPARSPAALRSSKERRGTDLSPVELTDPGQAALTVSADTPDPADAEIIWEDQAPAAVRRSPSAEPATDGEPFWEDDLGRAAVKQRDKSERAPRPAAVTEGSPKVSAGGHQPVATSGQETRSRRGRRHGLAEAPLVEVKTRRSAPNAVKVLIVVVPLLVVTATAWRQWRRIRADDPLRAELGITEGIPALEAGEFTKAYQILSAAKAAVDSLGGAVADAEKIRDAAQEAAVFVNLCPDILEKMLEDAGRTDPAIWDSRFHDLYQGRTILVDSVITDAPGDGPGSAYLIDYVILPPGGATNFNDGKSATPDLKGLIDFNGFRLFEQASIRKGTKVTFGAKLASFKVDEKSNVWWVGLEPDSGVFIIHTKALAALGWPSGAEVDTPAESPP